MSFSANAQQEENREQTDASGKTHSISHTIHSFPPAVLAQNSCPKFLLFRIDPFLMIDVRVDCSHLLLCAKVTSLYLVTLSSFREKRAKGRESRK